MSEKKPYQKSILHAELEKNGWSVASVSDSKEWWIDEIWELNLTWSPIGKLAYITFVNDPDLGLYVWSAVASPIHPLDRGQDTSREFHLALGNQWESGLKKFVDDLNLLRNSD
ncbi:MAG: hypothetical protein HKN33_04070 [Pyrinomonadaceae bacterium]|nr:hypothetical protein [Pyrinomonadaceae bacterium]